MLAGDTGCLADHGRTSTQNDYIGMLLNAAAVLCALYNAKQCYDTAQKEWNMANKYYEIAQSWLDYYKGTYAPLEDKLVSDARSYEKPVAYYEAARGRARTAAWILFKKKLDAALVNAPKYCTGRRQDIIVELATSQANAVALADGLGYRNERAYYESRDDLRFKRKLEVAKLGRNMVADNASLAKSSAGIYGDLYKQSWEGLKGAGMYLGYANNRNETIYPQVFTAQQTPSNESQMPMGPEFFPQE